MDKILTAKEVLELLSVSPVTLWRWRQYGTGPRWVKIGRHYRYRESDLEAWLEAQGRGPEERHE
jgi:excisionase family DNA binding protein